MIGQRQKLFTPSTPFLTAQLWRIDWIGGVAYNASVPSEPLIDVCLARLPTGLLLSRK
ncbi:MAG TPA: hypothetical protein VE860_00190 [Chthoniobacterales bacterium]|nr:hypothetical protein [Chthoniobacterales bacterium]